MIGQLFCTDACYLRLSYTAGYCLCYTEERCSNTSLGTFLNARCASDEGITDIDSLNTYVKLIQWDVCVWSSLRDS